ncbi:MAG: acyl-CoA dehydrogenase [Thermoleophilia bacterium]|jgi:alkylation response protein AidB-like acyl-CoA dehydrogenase|nr:acyl-CoA dehydrogenase [Thermoleophilia bacterium]
MSTVDTAANPWGLTESHLEIREHARGVARKFVAPRAHDIDAAGEFPQDIRELFMEQGLFGLPYDEEHGGTGTGTLALIIAIEEIAKVCATSALLLAVQELGSLPIKFAATEEQKAHWLPKLASGESLAAYGLTEPESGSDSAGMRTTARLEGGEWVLNGGKRFITNAGVADVYTIFAKTDPDGGHAGISAFIVPADAAGFTIGKYEKKMGIKGSTTGELFFDDCRIPAENILGEPGTGFTLAMKVLDHSRPGVAAQGLGIAGGAIEYSGKYLLEREQFGKPIAHQQGLQWMLADMETRVVAARELLYRAAWMIDAGGVSRQTLTKYSAMAKLACTDAAMAVTTDAVQLLGGYGYIQEYPVERMMRDAKITQIYEGTNQVQRLVIGRNLLEELRHMEPIPF